MTADDLEYYLSRSNPIANTDQRELERVAMRLFARPDVQTACRRAEEMWRRVTDRLMSQEQFAMFRDAVANYCFRCVMVAANTDANYPRVFRVYTQEAEWLGHSVPGSKWGGDNPNNAYRIIPVAADGRYELHGQRRTEPSTYVTFQLVANSCTSVTMGSLEQADVDIDSDGRYVITLDATPAGGRRNHLTIPPGTLYLFIRDSMGDWQAQWPDALRIRRLNPPTRAPLSDDELAATAIRNIVSDVFYAYYAGRLFYNAPQMMVPPEGAGAVGGLVTQRGSLGHFTLAEDDAVVITATEGGATYRDIVLHDLWLRSLENRNQQMSLTNAQMKADADGRFTYVISIADPGVHNWLDTGGLHDVLVLHRWQGIRDADAPAPTIEYRKVPSSQLTDALPPGVVLVTPDERADQLRRRRAAYDRRFASD